MTQDVDNAITKVLNPRNEVHQTKSKGLHDDLQRASIRKALLEESKVCIGIQLPQISSD